VANETAIDYEALTTKIPDRLQRRFWDFSERSDRIVNWALVPLIVFAFLVDSLYGLGVAAFWAALMFQFDDGRVYHLFGQWVRGLTMRTRVWEARPARKTRWALPRASPVRFAINAIGTTALLHDERQRTDTIIVDTKGSGITSLGISAMYRTLDSLADVIKKVASLKNYSVGISFVYRERPTDAEEMDQNYLRGMHQVSTWAYKHPVEAKALLVETQDLPDSDRNLIDSGLHAREVRDSVMEPSSKATMAMVLTIQREGHLMALSKGKRDSLAEDDFDRLQVTEIGKLVVNGLRGIGVSEPHVLDIAGIHAFLFGATNTDPKLSAEYYKWLASADEKDIRKSRAHQPQQYIDVFKHYCVIDGIFHTTLRLTGNPSPETDDFFHQLHGVEARWPSVALVGKTVKSDREVWWLNRFINIRNEILYGRLGMSHEGPKTRDRSVELVDRQEEIYRAHFKQDYIILVAVSATSKRELDREAEHVIQKMNYMGGSGRRIRGKVRQLPYLWAATIGK
jgi:hypothetical protein